MTTPKYAVIGAGAAGLSALAQLRKAGIDADCFEKDDRVAGHWNTDYDALHLITARDQTFFEDFPMPADYPHFPRRDQVRDYIVSFAEEFALTDHIRFSTAVEAVEPIGGANSAGTRGWTVRTRSSDGTVSERDYDAVLVANGHLRDAKIPNVPGTFTGKQIHSSEYANTGDIDGDRVLVVGAGNSGCDLAVDAAQHRFEVDIVIRKGVFFQPKTYFGRPRQMLEWMNQFSAEEQDFISRLLAKVSLGDNTEYPGLPAPAVSTLAEGYAVVNDLLLYWIHHGRISVRPAIERFDGRTVTFDDGTQRDYDTILYATGFNPSLPFLDDRLVAKNGTMPVKHAAGIIPAGLDNLYYIGLTAPRGPQIPIYGMQAALVAKMLQIQESGTVSVAEFLSERFPPEHGIDIVRAPWLKELSEVETAVDALLFAEKSTTATGARA
ncbi:NAD(P)-binding domain-containing protein [Brevibacterium sediminis]|uniref:flavin-containing monooxygenase n=1 Tax=Brevibacterium sediminis TaxID=1857024 RepID=UPI0021756A0E|nr:NAD(P)-binding domain-containing protein [Brevibacterium sediminis]MCS4592573.1 NAD(P)-binding domain-containing protein [Brevibacterium sediminis]